VSIVYAITEKEKEERRIGEGRKRITSFILDRPIVPDLAG
jgi:hypothetical protein